MANKVVVQPYKHGEQISKSRKLTGINKWAASSEVVKFVMMILGWFTIPFEVVFRRDFGQRWFNAATFFAGLLLVTGVECLFYLWKQIWEKAHSWIPFGLGGDFYTEQTKEYFGVPFTLLFVMIFPVWYFYRGLYHLFKTKWRVQSNKLVHSLDDGSSRLLWLGKILKWILNITAIPVMAIFYMYIPPSQRRGTKIPKLILDAEVFTNTCVEPGIVFALGFVTDGVIRYWLFISAIAIFVYAQYKEMARKSKIFDFQDSRIQAGLMRQLKEGKVEVAIVQPQAVQANKRLNNGIKKRETMSWGKLKNRLKDASRAENFSELIAVFSKERSKKPEGVFSKQDNSNPSYQDRGVAKNNGGYPNLNEIIDNFHAERAAS